MNFGEKRRYRLFAGPGQGLAYMFHMMNEARLP